MIKGKKVKDSAGKWTSSSKKVATVNKNGVVKVTGAGTATIKFTDKKSKKTASVKIYGRVRAAKMMLTPAAVMVKEGESADVAVSYELSKKVQAAGGKATTYKLFAESSDEKVATVSVDGNNKVMVKGVAKSASPVSITVYAAQVNDLAKAKEVKIKLTEKFDVKVSSKLEAKQAGANKIKVMGTDLVASKSAYVIKNANGGILELKNEVKVNAEKTEADLESVTNQIPVGKYTLSYNGGDAVEFEIVKVVAKSIEITPSGTAIIGSSDRKKAYTYFKVLDQFGNDVTNSPVVNLRINSPEPTTTVTKNKITFETTKTNGYQYNYDRISVSIVDINTGVANTSLLTIGDAAKIVEAKYEKIYNVSKKEIVDTITDGDTLSNFKLLFTAVDQYGNELVDEGNAKELVVNLSGTTGVTVKNTPSVIEYKNKKYYAYELDNIGSTATTLVTKASRPGEVMINAVNVNNGKSVADKFNVIASAKVDTFRIWEGNDGIFNGKKNELGFAAYDANGKEITDWDKLKAFNDSNFTSEKSKFYFEKKSDGKVAFYYDLAKNPIDTLTGSNSMSVPAFFRTQTDKFTNVTLNVKAQQYPVAIVGLKADTVKGAVAGKAFTVEGKDVRFQDQYGNLMAADDIVNPADSSSRKLYKVNVTANNNTALKGFTAITQPTDITNATNIVNLSLKAAGTDVQTDNITLQLQKNKVGTADYENVGEAYTFQVYAVPLDKMNRIELADISLKPAKNVKDPDGVANTEAAAGFVPEVFGYYAGEKIALKVTDDFVVLGADADKVVPSEIDDKNVITKKDEVSVVVKDSKATSLKKEYSYTNAARVIKSVKFKGGIVEFADGTPKGWDAFKDKFEIKDQYGETKKVAPYITFTGDKEELGAGKKAELSGTNGTAGAMIKVNEVASPATNHDKDAKVTIKLAFPGSNVTFETEVVLHRTA